MKKFLVFTMIGMALAIYIYGIVDKYILIEEVKPVSHIEETTISVYME